MVGCSRKLSSCSRWKRHGVCWLVSSVCDVGQQTQTFYEDCFGAGFCRWDRKCWPLREHLVTSLILGGQLFCLWSLMACVSPDGWSLVLTFTFLHFIILLLLFYEILDGCLSSYPLTLDVVLNINHWFVFFVWTLLFTDRRDKAGLLLTVAINNIHSLTKSEFGHAGISTVPCHNADLPKCRADEADQEVKLIQ